MQYHILDQASDGNSINIVFHVAFPDDTNVVGVKYRTALVASLGGTDAITSKVATGTELTSMKAGAIIEIPWGFRFSSHNLNDSQKLAEINAFYSVNAPALIADWKLKLTYWGFQGDAS